MKIHDNFRQVVIMMTSDLYGAIYDDIVNYEATEENRDKEFYYDTYRMIHDILDYHIYADKRNNTLTKYYYLNITEEESNDLTLNTYIEYIKTFDRENEYKVFESNEEIKKCICKFLKEQEENFKPSKKNWANIVNEMDSILTDKIREML